MSLSGLLRKQFPLLVIAFLLLNLLAPVSIAHAEGDTPPSDPTPTSPAPGDAAPTDSAPAPTDPAPSGDGGGNGEVVPTSEEQPTEGTTEEDSGPQVTATDATVPSVAVSTEDSGSVADESVPATSTAEPQAEEPAPEAGDGEDTGANDQAVPSTEDNPVAEAVQVLDQADGVLIGEDGQPISLATQEAEDVLSAPDPQFCPAGLAFGDAGCSTSRANITDALNDWVNLGYVDGTIYIEGGASFAGITVTENAGSSNLVFQGGVGGGTTTITSTFIVSGSTFNSFTFKDLTFDAGFEADGNTGDLSFNTVTVNNPSGDGISISDHNGSVDLNRVHASGTDDDGADIDNTSSTSEEGVTVTNSTFNANDDNGLEVYSKGEITINNVSATGNGYDGIDVDNTISSSYAPITVTNSTSQQNANDGFKVYSAGTITLDNVNANNNDDDGAEVYNDVSLDYAIHVSNSNFNGNGQTALNGYGLDISSFGEVTISNVSASNNQGSTEDNLGLYVDNTFFGNYAPVTITNSVFNGNVGGEDSLGLAVFSDGKITLQNVTANQNGDSSGYESFGAVLDNSCGCASEDILVKDSTFNGNVADGDVTGLVAASNGVITLRNVSASNNTSISDESWGADLGNTYAGVDDDASIKVVNSSFDNNVGATDGLGLYVTSQGDITLNKVSASNNSVDGVDLAIDAGLGPNDTSIICSSMQNNSETGILVDGQGGNLTINSTTTAGNGVSPLYTSNVANIFLGSANCNQGQSTDSHHRDSKQGPLNPRHSTNFVLETYPHSVTFPPMDLLECEGFVKSLFYKSELPADLNDGDNFLRALSIRLEGCSVPNNGVFTISFAIPAAEQGNDFAVLFWDLATDSWVEINGALNADGDYTITWPETGTFVLVTR